MPPWLLVMVLEAAVSVLDASESPAFWVESKVEIAVIRALFTIGMIRRQHFFDEQANLRRQALCFWTHR